ncbi:MAG: hypothetical protein QOH35_706 [Acidobacteriaceae bacterium]|jgi:hypothetical protein|nr:hypothetical protein [Acidobacteriaceae bacterium]MEA2539340.1 hypothetical protein [Acidobacteriaceae bacterium]
MKLIIAGLFALSGAAFAANIAPVSYHNGTLVSFSMPASGLKSFLQPTLTSVTFRCLACHIPAYLERKREGPDPVLQPSIGFECAQPVTSGGLNESDQQIVYVGKNGK